MVVAKLSTLALESAAVLTGQKEKRSYALVNDTWSLLSMTLVTLGKSDAWSSAASGTLQTITRRCLPLSGHKPKGSDSFLSAAPDLDCASAEWNVPICIEASLRNVEASLNLLVESWQRNQLIVRSQPHIQQGSALHS